MRKYAYIVKHTPIAYNLLHGERNIYVYVYNIYYSKKIQEFLIFVNL